MKSSMRGIGRQGSEEQVVQVQVDIAQMCLVLALGRRMGLINCDGMVDQAACEKVLARGSAIGILPRTPGPAPTTRIPS